MQITATRVVETCLDGTKNIEKTLDRPTDRKFILHLAGLGTLEYFSEFSRPFFRITRPGVFIIKGVEGASTFDIFTLDSASDPDEEIAMTVARFRPPSGS